MERIFISYRRADRSFATEVVAERLSHRYGEEQVFFDKDDIQGGIKFPERIEKAVESSVVMIVVIGPDWVKEKARLMRPDDFVRLEIVTALKNKIHIIPVLMDGARMPNKKLLPEDLKVLSDFNAIDIPSPDEIEKLCARLDEFSELKVKKKCGTVKLSALDLVGDAFKPRFALTGQDQTRFEFRGHDVILNRETLDNDTSISAEAHAQLVYEEGRWFATDLSSNKASFIQIQDPTLVEDGDSLVFGQRVFKFHNNFSAGEPGFKLVSQGDGLERDFKGVQVVPLNRKNLDKGNMTISSAKHAEVKLIGKNKWEVTDQSTNRASFVQIKDRVQVNDGTTLIFGKKLYMFEAIT